MLAIMHAGKVHMYLGESCHFKSVRGIIARLVFPHELQYFDTNSHAVLMALCLQFLFPRYSFLVNLCSDEFLSSHRPYHT